MATSPRARKVRRQQSKRAGVTVAEREPTIEEWEERQRQRHRDGTKGAAQLLQEAKDSPDFLVDQRIPSGAITFIVGPPGSTKSWLAYDLGLKVAAGRAASWLDTSLEQGEAPVLVLSYDNPTPETARRFKRLGLQGHFPMRFHSVDIDAWKMPTAIEQLTDVVHYQKPKLVIVDSFRQAVEGRENDSEDMGKVMGCFKTLAACPSKPAVVVVHHAGKAIAIAGSGARGSGEIEASADAVIKIEEGVATWTKARSWVVPNGLELAYQLVDSGPSTSVKFDPGKSTKHRKAAA